MLSRLAWVARTTLPWISRARIEISIDDHDGIDPRHIDVSAVCAPGVNERGILEQSNCGQERQNHGARMYRDRPVAEIAGQPEIGLVKAPVRRLTRQHMIRYGTLLVLGGVSLKVSLKHETV
jgi:hypothetical protein